MLGLPLHYGLYSMARTVVAGWILGFLDIAGVLADWNRSDKHLKSGVVGTVRVHRLFKSGVHERRWPTQAQLMRSDILRNIDVLGSGVLCRYRSPRGR